MVRANIQHADFGHNFLNATGAGDKQLSEELILNEIAILIEQKPMTIIQVMSTMGYKFIGTTRGDLVKAVTELMQVSPKFRVAISTLIAVNNGIVTVDQVKRAGVGDFSAFRTSGVRYHNDGAGGSTSAGNAPTGGGGGGAGGLAGGGGGMMGGDMITSIIGAIGGITSSSLQLAAAKAQKKSTEIWASSSLEQAKINAEAMANTSGEQTKQELLKTLGIKLSSGGPIPAWVKILAVVAVGGIVAFIMLSGKSSVMPPAPQVPTPPVAPPAQQAVGGGLGPPIPTSTAPPSPPSP